MVNNLKLVASELIHKLNYKSVKANEDLENQIYSGLKKEGYFVVDSFLSKEKCAYFRDTADNFITKNPDKVVLESNGSDQRVYGIDKYDPSFAIPEVERIADKIFDNFSFHIEKSGFYLFGLINSSNSNLGSGSGWHRDSPISHQFKFILYLSDVSSKNGPFQFIEGSHKYKSVLACSKFLNKPLNQSRFSEEEINKLIEAGIVGSPKTFTANEGSLIFVNTRGLHRGAPLKENNRYALTKYHFSKKTNKFD